MNGKDKCALLKQIRRDIAAANDITLDIPECTHTGDCPGTCPRCESEVKYLERALDKRRNAGFKLAIAGISAGLIALSSASCDAWDAITGTELQGDMLPGTDSVELTEIAGELASEDTCITEFDGSIAVVEETLQGDIPMEMPE